MKLELIIICLLLLSACTDMPFPEDTQPPIKDTTDTQSDHILATKAICLWNITGEGWLPDPSCSPGGVNPDCTVENICTPGYTKTVRNVSQTKKQLVYDNYGVLTRTTGEWEMDHIVPLELCGSNDITNLYPQPADPRLGFKEKDRLENLANDLVCAGEETLADAQYKIATDWIAYYHEVIE